jgi:hypothetical protein
MVRGRKGQTSQSRVTVRAVDPEDWRRRVGDWMYRGGALPAIVATGAICGLLFLSEPDLEPSGVWAASIAQIVATLLIAIAVERDSLPPARTRSDKVLAAVLVVATFLALLFGVWYAAIVDGRLVPDALAAIMVADVAVLALVFAFALMKRLLPDDTRNPP